MNFGISSYPTISPLDGWSSASSVLPHDALFIPLIETVCRDLENPEVRIESIVAKVLGHTFSSTLAEWLERKAHDFSSPSPLLRRGLGLLLELDAFEQKWLQKLCPRNQTKEVTERMLTEIQNLSESFVSKTVCERSKKISHYFDQLMSYSNESSALSNPEKLALAIFCAMKFVPDGISESDVIESTQFGLPRSLHRDFRNRTIYVLSREHVPVKIGMCGNKIITQGLQLSFGPESQKQIIAEARNRFADEEARNEHRQEFALHQEIYQENTEGIWPIWSICTHKDSEGRVSSIMPWGVNLEQFVKSEIAVSRWQLIDMMRQLCCGVDIFHRKRRLHGDLKTTNILCAVKDNGNIAARLIDLGLSFEVEKKESMPHIFKRGFYGSIVVSPPEFVGQAPVENLMAVEMFALGVVFFEFVFRKRPSWRDLLLECYDAYDPNAIRLQMTTKNLGKMMQCIESEVLHPRRVLLQKTTRSIDEEIQLFVYNFLQLDLDARPTSQQAINEAMNLLQKELAWD